MCVDRIDEKLEGNRIFNEWIVNEFLILVIIGYL